MYIFKRKQLQLLPVRNIQYWEFHSISDIRPKGLTSWLAAITALYKWAEQISSLRFYQSWTHIIISSVFV